ncbi:hypothetical protein I4U23_020774 [Adineta vaga]|nr:hypothetical protein I4U23_020774 [Adineta vaga]
MVSNTRKEKNSEQHKHRSNHDRVEKIRKRERRSPSNDDGSRSPTPSKSNTTETSDNQREGTERSSLSIEETNKLRASLGLKPLTNDGASSGDPDAPKKSLNSDENFVHRPASNLTEKKRTEQVTEKLGIHKEKRLLEKKFLATPTIASTPSDSASSWVDKMRQMDEEKRKAAARARSLEQMDEDFGVGNIMREEVEKRKPKKYGAKDLTGLRVEHSLEEFKEGHQIILTLKDKKILSDKKEGDDNDDEDDEEDVLINVNFADNELAKQRAEFAKKKTPGYRAYNDDSETADEFGMYNPNKMLEQYDEKKKSSFRLESGGAYDMADEKFMEAMKKDIRERMQSLTVPTPKVASEFYTAAEMEQFKKPKKVTKKKLRSRKMLKADDLLAMDSSELQESSTSISLRPAESRRSTAIASSTKERPLSVSLNKIKRELITTNAADNDDLVGPDDDLSSFTITDDAFDELQAVVNKTMKLKTKKDSNSAEKALSELIEERDRKLKIEIKSEPMETGIILPSGPPPPDDKSLVLDTMSEFCRNVGENTLDSISSLSKLRSSKKINRTNVSSTKKSTSKTSVTLDPDDELLQHALEHDNLDDDAMDDTPADNVNTKPFRLEDTILSVEPTLDRGLNSALHLAVQKGYIEQDKNRHNSRFVSDISAKNYTVEDKSSYEIEDKHARRDRYTSGPLTEFKEKEHYRPDVKLEYVDDNGRRINEKEAFRALSHRFHGKGSGKKKTEKRAKKQAEEDAMKKMSSVDTPLQTCNLLKQKQIQLQQPYVILSANHVMSQSVIVPPVHDTSPPPLDDDVDENETITIVQDNEFLSSTTSPDVVENSNEEWKSVDDNNDTDIAQLQDDLTSIDNEKNAIDIDPTHEKPIEEENNNEDDWANFATFETKTEDDDDDDEALSVTTTSVVINENNENDWAAFASTPAPSLEQPIQQSFNDELTTKTVEDEDDDFGEFSEVQVASKPQVSSPPTNTLSSEQIESLISICFPLESDSSSTEQNTVISTELPSFTSFRNKTKELTYLESSLSLWNVLSNLSNDPVGIQFQWRKSNTERLFHQSLGVNERFRAKNVPLTPEILQPEKIKPTIQGNNEFENIENENKLPNESIRPHFDWKQSGLQNPLTDNDSSSLSSNVSKNEENVFDANKTLDLDFYVPNKKLSTEEEQNTTLPSSIRTMESPIIPQQLTQKHSVPIKTVDLFPGATTIISDDAKRIIDTLPNLSFMSAKALMFPIRFNANNNDELY